MKEQFSCAMWKRSTTKKRAKANFFLDRSTKDPSARNLPLDYGVSLHNFSQISIFFNVVVVIYSNKVSFCGKLKFLFGVGRPAMFVFARSRRWSKFFSRCTESISRDLLVRMTYFLFLQILWSFQKRFVTFWWLISFYFTCIELL